jgi:tetratricopeptide (TPR) repeat protein
MMRYFIIAYFFLIILLAGIPIVALADSSDSDSLADLHWRAGQKSLDAGDPVNALRSFRQSLSINPDSAKTHLSMAAACLAQGNDSIASIHLKISLELEPSNVIVRQNYADLLLRMNQLEEARDQFNLFIKDTQQFGEQANRHMIHAHSRLMAISEQLGDVYEEHLNRGIGLYLLALEKTKKDQQEVPNDQNLEALLFRAAGELTQARLTRNDQIRPCWYLYLVWNKLACSQPAQRWYRITAQDASLEYLTPKEFQDFHLVRKFAEVTICKFVSCYVCSAAAPLQVQHKPTISQLLCQLKQNEAEWKI